MSAVLVGLIDNGYKTSICVFFLVLSYKFYRSKYAIDSDCCKHNLRFHTANSGNEEIKIDDVLSVRV
jgi:hypothetical protein